jgi:hypothetical protein
MTTAILWMSFLEACCEWAVSLDLITVTSHGTQSEWSKETAPSQATYRGDDITHPDEWFSCLLGDQGHKTPFISEIFIYKIYSLVDILRAVERTLSQLESYHFTRTPRIFRTPATQSPSSPYASSAPDIDSQRQITPKNSEKNANTHARRVRSNV